MLYVRDLHVQFHNSRREAVGGVSFTIEDGEILGLVGESGSGKSVTAMSIAGLLPRRRCRYAGEVLLDGQPITRKTIEKLSFATCEHSFFPNLTPTDHKIFYRFQFPTFKEKRFDALMDFFELPMGKRVRSFSTGQKNQFEVILALCQGADYIDRKSVV